MREDEEQEWRRLWADKPALGSFPPAAVAKLGFAKRVKKDAFHRIWVVRVFLLKRPFLFYFKSDSPDCRCEGLVFVTDCKVEPLSGFLGQAHCVALDLAAPRKPSKGPQETRFLFGAADAAALAEWVACITGTVSSVVVPVPRPPDAPTTNSAPQVPSIVAPTSSSSSSSSLPSSPPLPLPAADPHPSATTSTPTALNVTADEAPANPFRDGYESNGDPIFLRPLACARPEDAWARAAGRGDYYSKPDTLTHELAPPTPLPKGMSAAQAFKALFSDHSDVTLLHHEKMGDTQLELPPWPATAGHNGPPHWVGWRQLKWEGTVYAPMRKQVPVDQQQSYMFLEDSAAGVRTLHVHMSTTSLEVQHGDTYRTEYVAEFLEERPPDGVCQTAYRVFGGITFLKNSLMKRKILAVALKDLEAVVRALGPLVQQSLADWAAANTGKIRDTELAFARWQAHLRRKDASPPKGPPASKPTADSAPAAVPLSTASSSSSTCATCFQPGSSWDLDVDGSPDIAALSQWAADPTKVPALRKSRAVEQYLERHLWEGMRVDLGNAELQAAGLRSINQLLLPARNSGRLDPRVLDPIQRIMAAHRDRPTVQDAALSLLYSLCTHSPNVALVAGHQPLVDCVVAALRAHAGMLPTLTTYVRAFPFLPPDAVRELDTVDSFPIVQYHGVPYQGAGRSAVPVDGSGSPPMSPVLAPRASTPVVPPGHKHDWLQRNFHIDDEVVDEFACHLQDPLPRQGTLYICHRHLCFASPFPPKAVVPIPDIAAIEKRQTARLFPTAIEVKTADKAFFFGGFVKRDKAYELIVQVYTALRGPLPALPRAHSASQLDGRQGTGTPVPVAAETPIADDGTGPTLRVEKVDSSDSDTSE